MGTPAAVGAILAELGRFVASRIHIGMGLIWTVTMLYIA